MTIRGVLRTWARVPFAGALLIGATGCATLLGARPLANAAPGATTFHTIRVGHRTRSYLLHLPPEAATGARLPLLLVFHGYLGNANTAMDASRMNAEADRRGFIVAYPNGTGALRYAGLSWNAVTCCGYAQRHQVDDVSFADSLVATLVRQAGADPARVYAAGFSAGGMLALRLACERAGTYAAVADVAGAMPDAACTPSRRVPVLFFQGAADRELRFDLRTLVRPSGHGFAHSLERALRFWAGRDGCATDEFARDSTDRYTLEHPAACPGAKDAVELYTVRDHPHAWPGGAPTWAFGPRPAPGVDASAIILDFFEKRH
ncbi:MAG TPA: PHB depolymerase family esterase [Gemmatimonadaceae bacterium]|nr:PHB depolymerase family esterase [Gemmatimonadaceae bacterium]